MSDTPRTDRALVKARGSLTIYASWAGQQIVLAEFARELERELNALCAAADEQVRTVSTQACRMNDERSGGYELEAAELSKKSWQGR